MLQIAKEFNMVRLAAVKLLLSNNRAVTNNGIVSFKGQLKEL